MKRFKRQAGFSLALVLILSAVLVLLGMAVVYLTRTGFESIAAENKHEVAANAAEYGLATVAAAIKSGNQTCAGSLTINTPQGISVTVDLVKGGNACFIWSKSNYKTARAVKVTVISLVPPNPYAPLLVKIPSSLSSTSSQVESCDYTCVTPAVISGTTLPAGVSYTTQACGQVTTTSNLVLVSNSSKPLIQNSKFYGIYQLAFGQSITNQVALLNKLSQTYGVQFNGSVPIGIRGYNVWSPTETVTNFSCTADDYYGTYKIVCSGYVNGVSQTYNFILNSNGTYTYTGNGKVYDVLNLAGAELTVYNLEGGKVIAKDVEVKGIIYNSTLVATDNFNLYTYWRRGCCMRSTPEIKIGKSILFANNLDLYFPTVNRGCRCMGRYENPFIWDTLFYAGGNTSSITLDRNVSMGEYYPYLGDREDAPVVFILNTSNASISFKGSVSTSGG